MGTRMLSSAESPVHQNWKQAVVEAKETDTVFLNQQSRPALRALRTERTAALQLQRGGALGAQRPQCGAGLLIQKYRIGLLRLDHRLLPVLMHRGFSAT